MKLDLIWSAHFEDRVAIHQYDDAEMTKERLFREILNKQRDCRLVAFFLYNRHTRTNYEIDLVNGRIFIRPGETTVKSTTLKPEIETKGTSQYNYRLIYFRRVTRHLTWAGKQIEDKGIQDIQYFLGFQYTNEKGENVKRLLQISKNDEVYFA